MTRVGPTETEETTSREVSTTSEEAPAFREGPPTGETSFEGLRAGVEAAFREDWTLREG